MLELLLAQLAAGRDLSLDQMSAAIEAIMQGDCPPEQIGALLIALRDKGETVEEIAGAAAALRRHMTPIRSRHAVLVDTCGTGGGGSKTFNISTAAALVTAAAGVPVAKHGNRSVTSRSGSADALAALGVNIQADLDCVTACLDELGICFCFAPLWHPSMQRVSAVRKQIAGPTLFNLLGPLANPAGAPFQLMGIGKPQLRKKLAAALALLGTRRAVAVCGEDGLGEITVSGVTHVTEIIEGQLRELTWTPADFGLLPSKLEAIEVAGPEDSARIIRQVLSGQAGPARDIVVANAAAALWIAGQAATTLDGAQQAAAAIDSGAAATLLQQLIARTNASPVVK